VIERLGHRDTDSLRELGLVGRELGCGRERTGEDAVAVLVLNRWVNGERAIGATRTTTESSRVKVTRPS
jgi:hypothetical protein